MKRREFRVERDYLGTKKIPISAFYGIQTERALENFSISGLHLQKRLIYALALLKKTAALANMSEKILDKKKGKAIVQACVDILHGKLDDQFSVDVFQAGAGTSENMNMNEVIANRALQILKKPKGAYHIIHPNDLVNFAQSTNDVFHSAIHIAAYVDICKELLPALARLERELNKKAQQWKNVLKSGRTHLRDALPMTLGQEFGAYAEMVKRDRLYLAESSKHLLALNLGGTAIGTGVTTTPGFQKKVFRELHKATRLPFTPAENLFEGTQSLGALLVVSGALRGLATDLIKIANDLRLLNSGPATGFDEISLPAVQPGSSIMPGKVNPAVAEMLDMVGFQVIGNDVVMTLCAQAGQLELNVMMPLAAYTLLHSINILTHSIEVFTARCVKGIQAHPQRCRTFLEKNPITVTALTPYIGYEKAAEVAKRVYQHDTTVREAVLEMGLLDKKTLDKALAFEHLLGRKRR